MQTSAALTTVSVLVFIHTCILYGYMYIHVNVHIIDSFHFVFPLKNQISITFAKRACVCIYIYTPAYMYTDAYIREHLCTHKGTHAAVHASLAVFRATSQRSAYISLANVQKKKGCSALQHRTLQLFADELSVTAHCRLFFNPVTRLLRCAVA